MEPTFTHDDMLTMRRALDAYIVYLKALNSDSSDPGKKREIIRVEDLYERLGRLEVL